MIKWFLIGCAIVALIIGVPFIWDKLGTNVQEIVVAVIVFLLASILVSFLLWYFYTGITS